MNTDQIKWAKKLETLLDSMPEGIELLVGESSIVVHPAGFYMREIWDAGTDMMKAAKLIDDASLMTISFDTERIRPNSETI